MKFTLIKSELKGQFVPDIVFEELSDTRSNDLKVILFVLKTEITDPIQISSQLNISHSAATSSLMHWTDKGLIRLYQESETVVKKRKELTSEIVATLAADPGVAALLRNVQRIFGCALSERYTNRFIALYVEECIPVDVILQITQYQVSMGMDNPAYILKVIRSWYTKLGLSSGVAVDEYLALCATREARYAQVCKIFNLSADKLKSSEKTIIDRWEEKLHMSMDMIEESYLRAGHLANIPYCNGILKAWSQKGFKEVKDLQNEISNITQSKRNIDLQEDLIVKGMKNVPIFEK